MRNKIKNSPLRESFLVLREINFFIALRRTLVCAGLGEATCGRKGGFDTPQTNVLLDGGTRCRTVLFWDVVEELAVTNSLEASCIFVELRVAANRATTLVGEGRGTRSSTTTCVDAHVGDTFLDPVAVRRAGIGVGVGLRLGEVGVVFDIGGNVFRWVGAVGPRRNLRVTVRVRVGRAGGGCTGISSAAEGPGSERHQDQGDDPGHSITSLATDTSRN